MRTPKMELSFSCPGRTLVAVLMAVAACGSDDRPVDGPELVVLQIKRRLAGGEPDVPGFPRICECYQFVGTPAPAQRGRIEELVQTRDRPACDAVEEGCEEALAEDGWQTGWDSAYLFVSYSPLILERTDALSAPTVTLRIDGEEQQVAAKLSVPLSAPSGCEEQAEIGCTESGSRSLFAYGEVELPAALPAGFLSMRVKGSEDYLRDLPIAAIEPPEIGMFLRSTAPDGDVGTGRCAQRFAPVADLSQVHAAAVVPRSWAGEPAVTLVQAIDGIPTAPIELTGAVREGEAAVLRWPLRAPSRTGSAWDVILRSGEASTCLGGQTTNLPLALSLAGCEAADTVCPTPDCMFAGGVDKLHVTVAVDAEAAPQEAFVDLLVDDELVDSSVNVPLSAVDVDERKGVESFDVPPGQSLELCARAGGSQRTCVCAGITAPQGLDMRLVEEDALPGFDAAPKTPGRIATEPPGRCRALDLWVQSKDLAAGAMVEVVAGAGASFAGNATTVVSLDEPLDEGGARGRRTVTLAGNDRTLTEVGFTATAGPQSAVLVLPFERLHPSTATVQAAPDEQTLDATGSKAIVVTGVAYPPLDSPGVRFAPGTRLFIHTSAVQDAPMLACGTTLTAAEIECKPAGDPPTGACKFAPLYVEPDEKGAFSFTIPAGHCISGAVTLELWAEKYVGGDDDLCVGERAVTPEAAPLAIVQMTFE